MAFWLNLILFVAAKAVSWLLTPKRKWDHPSPSALGDFDMPTVGEGRPIPIVWGTCKIDAPMLTWYGDFHATPHIESTRGFFGWTNSEPGETGYKYWFGMQFVLCSGEVDDVLQIRFDDDVPQNVYREGGSWTGVIDYEIDDPELFGGDDVGKEGGVAGPIRVYLGKDDQVADDYLLEHIGGDAIPAYKGICYMVLRRVYLGMSPYLKNISVVLRRCPNSLGLVSGAENIDGDANPAAMLYDLLTSPRHKNGLGIPVERVDVEGLLEVGQALADEGLGLSILQDTSMSAKELAVEICKHVDAVVYPEPLTGLITMKLIRADYNPDTLPEVGPDNCKLVSFERPSWPERRNVVRIHYLERGPIPVMGIGES